MGFEAGFSDDIETPGAQSCIQGSQCMTRPGTANGYQKVSRFAGKLWTMADMCQSVDPVFHYSVNIINIDRTGHNNPIRSFDFVFNLYHIVFDRAEFFTAVKACPAAPARCYLEITQTQGFDLYIFFIIGCDFIQIFSQNIDHMVGIAFFPQAAHQNN
jgi:hypothetical protein